jgi:hypothetical protein
MVCHHMHWRSVPQAGLESAAESAIVAAEARVAHAAEAAKEAEERAASAAAHATAYQDMSQSQVGAGTCRWLC